MHHVNQPFAQPARANTESSERASHNCVSETMPHSFTLLEEQVDQDTAKNHGSPELLRTPERLRLQVAKAVVRAHDRRELPCQPHAECGYGMLAMVRARVWCREILRVFWWRLGTGHGVAPTGGVRALTCRTFRHEIVASSPNCPIMVCTKQLPM
jgi:hypothetical protein